MTAAPESAKLNLDLLIKLLKMTTSSHDGEALVACRKANEILKKFGGDWDALLRGKVTIIEDPFVNVKAPDVRPQAPPPAPAPRAAPRARVWHCIDNCGTQVSGSAMRCTSCANKWVQAQNAARARAQAAKKPARFKKGTVSLDDLI